MIFTCNVSLLPRWRCSNMFLWPPFIKVTKGFSIKECTVYCVISTAAADTVILRCQLSQDVNTWPPPVSAHQVTQSLYECLCAQKPLWRQSYVRHSTDQPIILGWGWQGKGDVGVPMKGDSLTRRAKWRVGKAQWVESVRWMKLWRVKWGSKREH